MGFHSGSGGSEHVLSYTEPLTVLLDGRRSPTGRCASSSTTHKIAPTSNPAIPMTRVYDEFVVIYCLKQYQTDLRVHFSRKMLQNFFFSWLQLKLSCSSCSLEQLELQQRAHWPNRAPPPPPYTVPDLSLVCHTSCFALFGLHDAPLISHPSPRPARSAVLPTSKDSPRGRCMPLSRTGTSIRYCCR